jgi:hypothetical protein
MDSPIDKPIKKSKPETENRPAKKKTVKKPVEKTSKPKVTKKVTDKPHKTYRPPKPKDTKKDDIDQDTTITPPNAPPIQETMPANRDTYLEGDTTGKTPNIPKKVRNFNPKLITILKIAGLLFVGSVGTLLLINEPSKPTIQKAGGKNLLSTNQPVNEMAETLIDWVQCKPTIKNKVPPMLILLGLENGGYRIGVISDETIKSKIKNGTTPKGEKIFAELGKQLDWEQIPSEASTLINTPKISDFRECTSIKLAK